MVKSSVILENMRPFLKAPEIKLNITQKGKIKGRTHIFTDTSEKNKVTQNKQQKS